MSNRKVYISYHQADEHLPLSSYGSPIYSRDLADAYAIALLEKGHDVEWRLETLRRIVDFPSMDSWSFLLQICDTYIGPERASEHLQRLRDEAGLGFNPHLPVCRLLYDSFCMLKRAYLCL